MGKGGKTERAWLCNVVHVNGMVRCMALKAGAGLAKPSSNQRARQHLGAAPIHVNDAGADVTIDVVFNSDNVSERRIIFGSISLPRRRRLSLKYSFSAVRWTYPSSPLRRISLKGNPEPRGILIFGNSVRIIWIVRR